MKNLTFMLFIFAILTECAYVDAQDVKNKEEMENVFESFVLNDHDFNAPVEEYQKRISTDWYYGYIGKPDVAYDEYLKDNYLCYEQTFCLTDKTKIRAVYYFLKSSEDAMKTTNYLVSNVAVRFHALSADEKNLLGLNVGDSSYGNDGDFDSQALRIQCRNVAFLLSVHSSELNKEEREKECCKYVKIIVERIKKRASFNFEQSPKQTPATDVSENPDRHGGDNNAEFPKAFESFVLRKNDVNSVKEFKESSLIPANFSLEPINMLNTHERIAYKSFKQNILLDDGSAIEIVYLLLKNTEDAIKVANCLASRYENRTYSYSFYHKKYMNMEGYETAYFCDDDEGFTLNIQCRNACITFRVVSDTWNDTYGPESEYVKIVKAIVERIKLKR